MVPRINVTTDIVAVSDVLTRAFSNAPVTSYVLREKNSQWTAPNIPLDLLKPKMLEWTTYKSRIGGELAEAGNYAAVAIWFVSFHSRPKRLHRLIICTIGFRLESIFHLVLMMTRGL
jgi:hypothetical protein